MADILRNLNRSSGGRRICGTPWVGLRGDALPSGGLHGQSPLFLQASLPADNAVRFSMQLVTVPAELVDELFVYEDGSMDLPVQPDGSYVVEYWLKRDGVTQPTLYDFLLNIGSVSRALTGVSAVCSVGSMGVTKTGSLALSGVVATGAVGSVTPIVGATRALTGVQATGAVGNLTPYVPGTVALTGVFSVGMVGSVGTIGGSFGRVLTGVVAVCSVGSMLPLGGSAPTLVAGPRRADSPSLDRRANTPNLNRRA